MNILSISNYYKYLPYKSVNLNDREVYSQNFGLKMTSPLNCDTVSFKGTPTSKLLKKRGKGINLNSAKKIYESTKEQQVEIEKFVRGIFKPYLVSNEKPDNLIEFVAGRAKKPGSIVEKSDILELSKTIDVLNSMTDLNATKAVLLCANRKNVHKTLDILSEAIERGFIILEEIEVKRPKAAKKFKGNQISKYDYADPIYLENFVKNAENHMGKKVNFLETQYHPINYTAIHFLFRLPGQKRVFEFQLMGHNVSVFKDLDDILFKVLNNKNVDNKYKPLVQILKDISMSEEEKRIIKYAKIREKIDKIKFNDEENEKFLNRLVLNDELVHENDTNEYKLKIQNLLRLKDIDKKDLKMLVESTELEADYLDKENLKQLKIKAERYEKFNEYRAQAFLYQREKKTNTTSSDIEYFLPLSVDLPHEYDLNELNKIYQKCKNL